MKVRKVDVYESERGRGQELLTSTCYSNEHVARKKYNDVNGENTSDSVPDYYQYAELNEINIEMPSAIYRKILQAGVKGYSMI